MCHWFPSHQTSICFLLSHKTCFSFPKAGTHVLSYHCFQFKVRDLWANLYPFYWMECGSSWSRDAWAKRACYLSQCTAVPHWRITHQEKAVVEDTEKSLALNSSTILLGRYLEVGEVSCLNLLWEISCFIVLCAPGSAPWEDFLCSLFFLAIPEVDLGE